MIAPLIFLARQNMSPAFRPCLVSTPQHGSEANGASRGLKTGCPCHAKPESGVEGTQGKGKAAKEYL